MLGRKFPQGEGRKGEGGEQKRIKFIMEIYGSVKKHKNIWILQQKNAKIEGMV